ncbi:MAG: hypothetical protein WKH64_12895 [Chloroflexia bacterium]
MLPLVREAHSAGAPRPTGGATTPGCSSSRRLWTRSPPPTSSTTTTATRCWRISGQAHHSRPGHTRLVARVLAALPGAGRIARTSARPRPLQGRHPQLELALDVMDAVYNDRGEVWPVNVPNRGSISDLPDGLVVEVQGYVDAAGVQPLAHGALPPQVSGLVKMLGEYQYLAAQAGWCGTRRDAIQALASNPLVLSVRKAEAVYDEMAGLHREYLPERLLHD